MARQRRRQKQERTHMERQEAFAMVVKILTPHVKNMKALDSVSDTTNILDDLKVNSARLVDVVLAFEDEFDIEIPDEDVDLVNTVGDCVNMILEKAS
jgi:acyl carrier protein